MGINLPTTKHKPKVDPKLLVLYGEPKIGKTGAVTQLEDALIIDTENGTAYHEALAVNVNSWKEFIETLNALHEANKKGQRYKHVVLDTIDNVAFWAESEVVKEYNLAQKKEEGKVKLFSDIPYGGGYAAVRDKVLTVVNALKNFTDRVIVIGHLKQTLIGTDTVQVNEKGLDLGGKLKSFLMADADSIGLMYRDKENGELRISFLSGVSAAAGSRCTHLRNADFIFDWNKIYIDTE